MRSEPPPVTLVAPGASDNVGTVGAPDRTVNGLVNEANGTVTVFQPVKSSRKVAVNSTGLSTG